ncbi:hypothetical protein OQA88_5594 [Cercophora sp. LCS_1]
MNNILPTAATGIASTWQTNAGRTDNPSRMGAVRDLIDPKQVELFDALKELSGLQVSRKIQIPQLIVLGDQSAGKSSVLEAIGRFHFPVDARVCTQFPTELILRRAAEERTLVTIRPASARSKADQERLRGFSEQLLSPEDFPALVNRVRAELGVPASTPHGVSGSHETLTFVEDVLVVQSSGPDLVQVDLVDLPGLFTASTQQQDEAGREAVNQMVRKYVSSKNSLVLLVVSLATSFANQASRAMIQKLTETDPGLVDRVIGVMTNPDRALSVEEAFDVLNGRLDSTNLRHRWLVVRNQNLRERTTESLGQRDRSEVEFFLREPGWSSIPEGQWGIDALRNTLRVAFLQHTHAALPTVIAEVEETIETLEARLAGIVSRSTDQARRLYLCGIARKFESLARQACFGTYQDDPCRESHNVGRECRACARFFPRLSDESPKPHEQNLRANIRLLSKAFAFAMSEFGKTIEVGVSSASQPNDSSQRRSPVDGLLGQDVMANHYTFPRPRPIERQGLDEWLAARIPHWRGREPQGETSETTYHLLFEYLSEKWATIAGKHLDAVWLAVQRFVDAALQAACPDDDDVRSSLCKHMTQPALKKLKDESDRTMMSLLACHARGKTGFYDGFVDVGPLRQRTRNLSRGMDSSISASASASLSTSEWPPALASETFKFVLASAGGAPWLQASGILAEELVRGKVFRELGSALADAFRAAAGVDGAGENQGAQEASFVLVPQSMDNLAASRAVENVEMFYEMSMMAFVGYVNSLVVESGILYELPNVILTQHRILVEDAAKIDMIAGEKASDARERERDQADLKTLKVILETLRGFWD